MNKKTNEWMSELFNWEKNNLSLLLYCWTNTDYNLKILWVHRNVTTQRFYGKHVIMVCEQAFRFKLQHNYTQLKVLTKHN